MTSLASYNKSQLIELINGYRTQIDDLTQANEMLSSAVEDAAQPADAGTPGDMMVKGLLKQVKQATRRDGTFVDDFYKFAVELSVGYTVGKDADGKAIYENVNAYKTLWFNCDGAMASTLTELIEANEWTLVRSWYRYGAKEANVISTKVIGDDGKPVVDKNGEPVFRKKLRYAADLCSQQVDVVKFKAKPEADDDNTTDVDDNDV